MRIRYATILASFVEHSLWEPHGKQVGGRRISKEVRLSLLYFGDAQSVSCASATLRIFDSARSRRGRLPTLDFRFSFLTTQNRSETQKNVFCLLRSGAKHTSPIRTTDDRQKGPFRRRFDPWVIRSSSGHARTPGRPVAGDRTEAKIFGSHARYAGERATHFFFFFFPLGLPY